MLIIGDIHGDYKGLLKILKRYRGEPAVQIGDFGIGFEGDPPLPDFPDELRFIRGNHDNPIEAYKTRHYLGDFGYQMIDELNVFFLSGAASTDRAERTEGKDWWIGEELSLEDLEAAIDL